VKLVTSTGTIVFGMPARLIVAYMLILLLVVAALAFALWNARRTQQWRDKRARERLAERYQERREAALKRDAADS
jgi:uncharacterized iron-regulated membrane protein